MSSLGQKPVIGSGVGSSVLMCASSNVMLMRNDAADTNRGELEVPRPPSTPDFLGMLSTGVGRTK
eukprot:CAMPEP_0170137628 /NCGR_PEP_ID=MMETSP0033_2-20121228/4294_1 /TAXON_ID=195969 /ORGANISM="Dolichomastix tenuilepis, Strain CCMP3274" /LENGTH=64 /DNA_ID=CAMNT_0010373513 /DNA_START=234 /DNA_END=425 /DNA_ORIENTATION=-